MIVQVRVVLKRTVNSYWFCFNFQGVRQAASCQYKDVITFWGISYFQATQDGKKEGSSTCLARLQIILVHLIGQSKREAGCHTKVLLDGCHTKVLLDTCDILSDHSWDLIGHLQILVGHCPMSDCYLQPCLVTLYFLVFSVDIKIQTSGCSSFLRML